MRKHASLLAISVIAAVLIGGLAPHTAGAAAKLPSFRLEDVVTGKEIDSRSFKGKSLLITFFATWCPPCLQEIPGLIRLQDEYGKKRFSVVGFSVDQEKGVVQELIAKKGINYPVMMADNAITRQFGGVYGVPTSFLVNGNGTIVKQYPGYVSHADLVRDINQILP